MTHIYVAVVGLPIAIRVSGDDITVLRSIAGKRQDIAVPVELATSWLVTPAAGSASTLSLTVKPFAQLVVVHVISVSTILARVFQFRSTTKPLVVFAAILFGIETALLGLRVMGAAFGFMAFLGIISLIGVIVSHVIVLFDYVEDEHERGKSAQPQLGVCHVSIIMARQLRCALVCAGLASIAFEGTARGETFDPASRLASLTQPLSDYVYRLFQSRDAANAQLECAR